MIIFIVLINILLGIFMFSRLSEISDWRTDYKSFKNGGKVEDEKNVEAYVVQRYLLHPLLIGMIILILLYDHSNDCIKVGSGCVI